MNKNARINRRRGRVLSRDIARNLRAAARTQHLRPSDVRRIELDNGMHLGALFLTFTGLRVMVSHVCVLQDKLGLSVDDLFAGTQYQAAHS